jgi:hypothetical protein
LLSKARTSGYAITLSPSEVHSEQAFSADGGTTWKTNWIDTYTRVSDKAGE